MVAFSKVALGAAFAGIAAASPLSTAYGPQKLFHELSNVPSSWTSSGAVSKDAKIHVQIGLKQNNIDKLQAKLLDISDPESPNYGNWLSREELHKMVAPPAANVAAVKSWLASHGIKETSQASPDWIEFTAPVSTVESLLSTKYEMFTHKSQGTTAARTKKYSVPEMLHEMIDMVTPTTAFYENLDSQSSPMKKKKKPKASGAKVNSCDTSTITPKCIKQLYNVDYTPTGVADIGVTGLINERASHADYSTFGDKFVDEGLNDFSDVSVAGGQNNENSTLTGEGNLDIQYAGGLATPNNNTYIACADGDGDNDSFATFASYLTSSDDAPKSVSTSYGGDESSYGADYLDRVCNEFMKAGSLGISVFFSSGDTGVAGNYNPSCKKTFYPLWPASCPWITAVGGTQFSSDGTEVVAQFGGDGAGGSPGGGFSSHFQAPSYQSKDTAAYVKSLNGKYAGKFNATGRGIPDVALVATNYQIVVNGDVTHQDGTSASAPAWAGLVSILNDYRLSNGKPTLGFLNPLLYGKYRSAFNDITSGNNHGCGTAGFSAAKGWDPASGLGSVQFDTLRSML